MAGMEHDDTDTPDDRRPDDWDAHDHAQADIDAAPHFDYPNKRAIRAEAQAIIAGNLATVAEQVTR